MEVSSSCVPVTALHVCSVDDHVLMLFGQGSSLTIYDYENRRLVLRQKVFRFQVIHGISTRPAPAIEEGETDVWVLLLAGTAAALLRLSDIKKSVNDYSQDVRLILRDLHIVNPCGWALFGEFFELAHPAVARAYVVTAQNEVCEIILEANPVDRSTTIRCHRLVSGPECVLYSAHARFTLSGLLIAAGTVFGEVVVWSANKNETSAAWNAKILNVYLGHRGSIFGVCISEDLPLAGAHRLLATCSDDRTIRLWSIEDGSKFAKSINPDDSDPISLADVTGFGDFESDSSSSLAVVWGHLSRIWTVDFLPAELSSPSNKINLISVGEDASFHLWEAVIDGTFNNRTNGSIDLQETGSYANHSGKNIWSSAHHLNRGKYTYFTGGADGSIVANILGTTADLHATSRNFRAHMTFDEIFHQIKVDAQENMADGQLNVTTLKQYALAGNESILATTARGDLLHGKLKEDQKNILWQRLYTAQSRSALLLCSDRDSGSVFFASASSTLFAIEEGSSRVVSSSIAVGPQASFMCVTPTEVHDISQGHQSSILISLSQEGSVILLSVLIGESIHLRSSARLHLPTGFVPTSGCHHKQRGLLLLGSRSGSIAVFETLVDFGLATAVFLNIHDSDTVTSVMLLRSEKTQSSERDLFILTSGRDGTYAVHRLLRPSSYAQIWTLHTVHQSSPPIGPNIEGAYLARVAAGQNQDLTLYGFKSKDFVVWNETQQTEILSIDCGGAHRSWGLSPSKDITTGQATYGGTFVWTKAGAFNIYSKSALDRYTVQTGGHGREIKAVAVSPIRLSSDNLGLKDTVLIATGAEDTSIRLFAVEASDLVVSQEIRDKSMKCIRILNKHTTGIHHLEFSPCGNYLFSSGGCEEIFVWRIYTNVPIIGVGVILECMLPKTQTDADARITNFTIGRENQLNSNPADKLDTTFEMAATYSNGKVKILRYSCERGTRKGQFKLLEEIVEGSFCLTQLHHDAKDEILLTAGTSGFINVHFPQQWNFLWKHRVHENSIQASLLVKISEFSSTWLVVTGGDDNALGLTIFCPDRVSSNASSSAFRTLLIPSAHAAAVTGLALLSRHGTLEGSDHLIFASLGNDQKVKVWRVAICVNSAKGVSEDDAEMQNVQIERVSECWTTVADAAAMKLLGPVPGSKKSDTEYSRIASKSSQELLIVGVGMETLRLALPVSNII